MEKTLEEITELADAEERVVFDMVQQVNGVLLGLSPDMRHAAADELAKTCGRILNLLARTSEPEAHFAELGLTPTALGHICLQSFGSMEDDRVQAKKDLLEFAHIVGPDNLEIMRWAVAFAQKVESF